MFVSILPNEGEDVDTVPVITIQLQTPSDLFAPPQVDAFDPRYHTQSGIEQLATLVKTNPPRDRLQVVFVLPAATPLQNTLKTEMQAAIIRYCDAIISSAELERAERRQTILHNVVVGVLILGASLGVGAAISGWEFMSAGLRNLLSNTVSILGTVALWSPVDSLLFGLRPLRKTTAVYTTLRTMSFELQFRDSS